MEQGQKHSPQKHVGRCLKQPKVRQLVMEHVRKYLPKKGQKHSPEASPEELLE